MDTGMGREGYSIVGQGRVDEILSTKSTDRREIFEEAAGISKYRHRKEEAERKLERTEENLVRINDKIAELELKYKDKGRLVVRASGTEPVLRIMLECETEALCSSFTDRIADVIRKRGYCCE